MTTKLTLLHTADSWRHRSKLFFQCLAAVILFSILLTTNSVDADARPLPQPNFHSTEWRGCLFSNEHEWMSAGLGIDHPERVPSGDGRNLIQIGLDIACGMAESTRWSGRHWATLESIVDLPALVTAALDRPPLISDPNNDCYWRYFSDCDRWNVVFADHVQSPPKQDIFRNVLESCRAKALALEFAIVENLPHGRLKTDRMRFGTEVRSANLKRSTRDSIETNVAARIADWKSIPSVLQYWMRTRNLLSFRDPNRTTLDMLIGRVLNSIHQNTLAREKEIR